MGSQVNVLYAEGCKITAGKQGWDGWYENNTKLADPAEQQASIREAVATAKKAQVAILVVGETEDTNQEGWSEQHLNDRDSLDLLGAQNQLVQAIRETGVPTVVLLINSRPLSINYIAEHVPAILEGCCLGQAGRLPRKCSFSDVNPCANCRFHSRARSASCRSITTTGPHAIAATFSRHAALSLRPWFELHDLSRDQHGSREGDETPQLYIVQHVSSTTRPFLPFAVSSACTSSPARKPPLRSRSRPRTCPSSTSKCKG